jgi:hypothetical protein
MAFPAGVVVSTLLVQVEIDALGVNFAEKADEVDKRAAEAIDRPSGDQIELLACDAL